MTTSGRIVRVDGSLVEAEGLDRVAMSWLVELGPGRLLGEVVAIHGETAGVQAYEYTGGLAVGDAVTTLEHPLAARLGPGLLGGVFDGLLRPLSGAGLWLEAGAHAAAGSSRTWSWLPAVTAGRKVSAGAVLGTVQGCAVEHRVLVPPGSGGAVSQIRAAGECTEDETVAVVGDRPVTLTSWWPVRVPRPVTHRLDSDAPLVTGQRVIDALFPLMLGGTAAVPGGFGTGKTVLLQQIAKWCAADVIVYVGCGERGNEMADVLSEFATLSDPVSGGRLIERTVVLANTSNMPMMAREASIYSAVAVAEFYRDMGYDAVVIADSTSRWAEALREFASRTKALPAEEGYPAGLSSALAAFYERAGRVRTLGGAEGSVTLIGAVSPQGGDMTEPVTAHTQRFVRSLWTLDRDLAYARHYPAVSWSGSFARDVEALARWYDAHGSRGWAQHRARLSSLLAEADRLSALAELMGVGVLPGYERVVLLGGRLVREGILQQSALSAVDASSGPVRTQALVTMVLDVVDAAQAAVGRGVPAASVEELDLSPVLRARDDAPMDDAGALATIASARDEVLSRIEALP